jgi:OOP family OmpA-OmpF porin
MNKLRGLILAIFAFGTFAAQAQQDSCTVCKPYPWEIGVTAGINQYFGDMHCSKPYASQNSFMGGIFVRRHLNDFFSLRPQILVGRLAGRDLDSPINQWDYRRLRFNSSPFVEAAILGEYYPFRERRFTCDGFLKNGLSPYIFAGVGVAYSNAKVTQEPGAQFPVNPALLAQDRAHLEKFGNRLGVIFPVGLGVKYNVSNRWTLGLEAGYRFSTSDYLDGISLAGNPDRKDGYFLGNVLASYRFGDKDSDGDGVVDKCDMCPEEVGLPKFQGCPDRDGDGIIDKFDLCPDVAGSHALQGCPDTDGDGIADKDDLCLDVAGLASLSGCPDRDGDGVADKDDACPDVAGTANGCLDSDGDGIADSEDACPFSAGTAELNGCPDSDGDGVADTIDNCLNKVGSAAAAGCPDADGDGVPDVADKCPNLAGLASNGGCPEDYRDGVPLLKGFKSASGCAITKDELDILSYAAQSIEFHPGTSRIKASSNAQLQKICDVIKRCNNATLVIRTYNDGVADAKNMKLATSRSAAVYNYFLSKKCIDKSRLSYEGAADEDQANPYLNAAGIKSGSRTEFILK